MLINNDSVRLCRKGSCCPILSRQKDGSFSLTDDFNGKVQLTDDELNMLQDAISHFKNKKADPNQLTFDL